MYYIQERLGCYTVDHPTQYDTHEEAIEALDLLVYKDILEEDARPAGFEYVGEMPQRQQDSLRELYMDNYMVLDNEL